MKISAALLYQELKKSLAPSLKALDFKIAKGGRLGWVHERDGRRLALWFQADKWGWDEQWGATFTLEFQSSSQAPGTSDMAAGRPVRIGMLLEGFAELDELRILNNQVIQTLPGTLAGAVVTSCLPDGGEYVVTGYRIDPAPALYGRDIWLNYYSLEDVQRWAAYFTAKLPLFIDRFANDIKSEQGKANERFNLAMGMVQSTNDIDLKMEVLTAYIASESDDRYRSAAQQWSALLAEQIRARMRRG